MKRRTLEAADVLNEETIRTNPLNPATTIDYFTVTFTRNGPLIIDTKDRAVSLKWTAFDPKNSDFNAFYSLNRAKDWNGFKKSLSTYGGAMQNFVYADVKGNIGWYAAGKLPVRRKGEGNLPYDGAGTDGDWVGFVPFAELPNLSIRPRFIMPANQRHAGPTQTPQLVRDLPRRGVLNAFSLLSKDTNRPSTQFSAPARLFHIPLKMLAEDTSREGCERLLPEFFAVWTQDDAVRRRRWFQ